MERILIAIGSILLVLWLFGLIMSYTFGGVIHLLLVIGVIMLIVWFIKRRR